MPRKPESVLIPEAHLKLKPMTLRVPSDVMDRMQRVKGDAQALGYVFDVHPVLIEAIMEAMESAERELEKILEKSS